MDEYEQIQELRKLWSRAIMTWGQIFIPLGATIVAFFVMQLPQFMDRGWGSQFLWIGWVLFSICMGYWRWVVHHIDEQIVGMYPRMLELERERGMEIQATYYYNNLHERARRELAGHLRMNFGELERLDYRQFSQEAIRRQENPHDLLLRVWDAHRRRSVTTRGHGRQDWAVFGISVIFLIVLVASTYLGWFNI